MSEDLTEESLVRLVEGLPKTPPAGMKFARRVVIPHEKWPLAPDQELLHEGDFVKQIDGRITNVEFEDCTHCVGAVYEGVAYVFEVQP